MLGSLQPPVGKHGITKEKSTIKNTAITKLGTLTQRVATIDAT